MAVIARASTSGREPLALRPGVLAPLDHETRRSRARWLQADGVRVDVVDASPHRFTSRPDDDEQPDVLLLMLVAGDLTGTIDGERFSLPARSAAVLDLAQPLELRVDSDVAMFRMLVDRRLALAGRRDLGDGPVLLLERTALVRAAIGFAAGLLDGPEGTRDEEEDGVLGGAVVDLQRSLIDEARRQREDAVLDRPTVSRRQRIERFVMANLHDPSLTPTSIAHRLGVSVRTVHAAFADDGESLAAFIRARRVAEVQAELRGSRRLPDLQDVAERAGFGSRDRLSRAFNAVAGASARGWWQRHTA